MKKLNVDFATAKTIKEQLEAEYSAAGKVMAAFPKGNMGLTPDHIKITTEWKTAYTKHQAAFQALRNFNAIYVKQFRNELAEERAKRFK